MPWIELVLESMRRNPTIKFLFVHNENCPVTRPANVEFIRLRLEDLKKYLAGKLEIPVSFDNPYKLCDFRPTFGFVFQQYLRESEFWGWVDNDLILGQIRKFLSDEVLQSSDIVTSWPTRIHGPFTILRNRPDINQLYQDISDYKNVFSSSEHHGVDEIAFNRAVTARKNAGELKFFGKTLQIGDRSGNWFEKLRKDAVREGSNPKAILPPIGPSRWHKGHIYHIESEVEAMFFHFMNWKKEWNPSTMPTFTLGQSEEFTIDKEGFHIV